MRLVSTRNPKDRATFAQAIQVGMAKDGGLYTPEPLPCFRDMPQLLDMDFQTRSVEILHRFLGEEFDHDELETSVRDAFDFPVPLVKLKGGVFALELFHGPTHAFKDFGARFLARMLELVAKKEGGKLRTVLTATSGDTGSAVAHAFHGRKGFRVMVLYPKHGVSALQEKQFATLGDNVLSYAVEGSFDDCQALVKASFKDPELIRKLCLTSANSINIARLLGQVPYYYEAVAQLRAMDIRDAPIIAVPSGNFGNLFAGLMAWKTGLPVKAFVVATNVNRVVPDYLESGAYQPGPSIATLSNAMDVGNPSNFERIRHLFEENLEAMRSILRWGSLTDAETRRSMWEMNAVGYLPEPHAAVACGVLKERLGLREAGIFLATAHPAKFREILERDMNLQVALPPALAEVMDKPVQSKTLPADFQALRAELEA
jgi:threonine synthase